MKRQHPFVFIFFSLFLFSTAHAGGVYQTQENFLAEAFAEDVPKAQIIWPDKKLNEKIISILGHKYKSLRIRYWKKENRTAWVLDEIGKEKSITTGFVITNQKIERVSVLVFRESRGWEVRHKFFTDQFEKISLKQDMQLSKDIYNISGATLSVRAITKLSRLALFLDQQVTKQQVTQ